MKCPHCQNEDESMMENLGTRVFRTKTLVLRFKKYLCSVCSKTFEVEDE